jgi:hypothetical protein
MLKRLVLILAIALLAGSLAVGCDALFDTPEKAAREAVESLFSGDVDKFMGRVCSARKGIISKQTAEQIKFLKKSEYVKVKVDLSGVGFTADVSGDTATVKTSGKMKIEFSLLGQTKVQEQPLDGSPPIKMVREEGMWKICDTQ